MTDLEVPYVRQANDWSCGPAAFEMVYAYYGKAGVKQLELFKLLKKKVAGTKNDWCVETNDLIADASKRGLDARLEIMELGDREALVSTLKKLVADRIPLIACQKYTAQKKYTGHFRVVVDVDDEQITFHDPCRKSGGPSRKWPIERFISFWKPSGHYIVGGAAAIIRAKT